jgi:peptide/nickel transport system substrate-binding protein
MGVAFRSAVLLTFAATAFAQGELRFSIHADPKNLDPLLADEEVTETVRYLTGGVLVRFNRQTQKIEGELASSWKVTADGRKIDFDLRPNLKYSDGSPFGAADVVATVRRMTAPGLQSGVADAFRSGGGELTAQATGPNKVSLNFSTPVAGLDMLFDQLVISPDRPDAHGKVVLGPFRVAEHKSGQFVLLERNPHYWKTGKDGKRLPYLDRIRLDIVANRDTELLRFRKGELHMVDKLEPEAFERLHKEASESAKNAGSSLDGEFFWFNQRPNPAVPEFKQRWFQSTLFRRAMSIAVNRDDIIRLVYRGYAHAAAGPMAASNQVWFNSKVAAPRFDPQLALKLLQQDGFRLDGGTLKDRDGNPVTWSLITNARSKTRAQIGALIQQDLGKIGVQVNFTPMEFQSLVERITRSQQYEACLLGLANIEIDPNSQMNVWMSSGTHHPWNPSQAKPATQWEAEIDRLMQQQHTSLDIATRKRAFDRIQEIISEQQPIIYLVHPDVLVAVAPQVQAAFPTPLPPHLHWNAEYLRLSSAGGKINKPVLSTELWVDYPQKPGVLHGVRIDVGPGEIVGLVGQSGSGKSTLALAILRLLDHTGARVTGRAMLAGEDLMTMSERQLRHFRGRLVSLIPQSPATALNPALRIESQLREAWNAHSPENWRVGRKRVSVLMEAAGLSPPDVFLRRHPREISVGQAQRVLIVMAVLHSPVLLIADEPTTSLDVLTQRDILELLVRLTREEHMSMLLISHDLLAVAATCHQLAILHAGEIVEQGPVGRILASPQHPYTRDLLQAFPVDLRTARLNS